MTSQNLYQIFDLPDYSEISLIKKSFRRQALIYHPDRNPNPSAAEKFKVLVTAYEILGNPELKQNYDLRLKSGFIFETVPLANTPETDREIHRRKYAKMRKDFAEMREVENITAYENSLVVMPFIWRLAIIGLLQVTGILSILSDWYQNGSKIAFGIFLFVFASLFLWNELYKFFWHKSLTKDEKKYERQAYTWFLTVFFVGIFATFSLIKIKKVWHLHYFGKVIYAEVDQNLRSVSYTYNDSFYIKEIYSLPGNSKKKEQILIRISTKEPAIWEFVEK